MTAIRDRGEECIGVEVEKSIEIGIECALVD